MTSWAKHEIYTAVGLNGEIFTLELTPLGDARLTIEASNGDAASAVLEEESFYALFGTKALVDLFYPLHKGQVDKDNPANGTLVGTDDIEF